MHKRHNVFFGWIIIAFFVICSFFYFVLLRLPIPFLAGIAAGLSAYWLSYGAIRIGLFPVLKWLLLLVIYSTFALLLYGFWYTVQHG